MYHSEHAYRDPTRSPSEPLGSDPVTRPASRIEEVRALVAALHACAIGRTDVAAALVVGSYAYGRPRADSDLDVVVVTSDTGSLSSDADPVPEVLGARVRLVREQQWGPLLERRFRRSTGLEVELGIPPVLARVPVDAGTDSVLRDGCAVVHDPHRLAADALRSLGERLRIWGVDDPWSEHPVQSPAPVPSEKTSTLTLGRRNDGP